MQTKESGKHDILPVAGANLDHARVPVTMPRESDADMCRDGSTTAQTVQTQPSTSPEECTAHQILTTQAWRASFSSPHRGISRSPPFWRITGKERRRWSGEKHQAQLGEEVKSLSLDADAAGTMVITRPVMHVTSEEFTSDLGEENPRTEEFTRMLASHTFAYCSAWRKNGGVWQQLAYHMLGDAD